MSILRIIGEGDSPKAQANSRGKLFEKMMAKVLECHGYQVDSIPSVNYAGMEIDIEGKHILSGIPLYAECKFYATEVDSPKIQEFYAKYLSRWFKNKHAQGLFVGVPGLNSHAKGFYRENCEANSEINLKLFEENAVLEVVVKSMGISPIDNIRGKADQLAGTYGDVLLVYTSSGFYWVQFIIPPAAGAANAVVLFDCQGNLVRNDEFAEKFLSQLPELDGFQILKMEMGAPEARTALSVGSNEREEIVEVKGSSSCFEYQFPASPEFFVGRSEALRDIDNFEQDVLGKQTTSRALLFEANSGWGKSSLVLASVSRLSQKGHIAVAIDCRSLASPKSLLQAVERALNKSDGSGDAEDGSRVTVSGFEGAAKALIAEGRKLEARGKILFIFFDQFENVFFELGTLRRICDLLLKVCDAATNAVLGFSWKSDLVGTTLEFPYQLRDTIVDSSRRVLLPTFSEEETRELLAKLSREIRAPLRKDLRFFLSEFSQGYPWLLKKLCAHVKTQKESGVLQADIAGRLLNVQDLFEEDLKGLSAADDDTLRRVARSAPVTIFELGEQFKPDAIQSLVHRRLLVRIGNRYDVYWDIFKEYLNTGKLPVQENYILRTPLVTVLRAIRILVDSPGKISTTAFKSRIGMTSENSLQNLAKDLRVLGLAKLEGGKLEFQLQIKSDAKEQEIVDTVKDYVKERLLRNRLTSRIVTTLKESGSLHMREIGKLLSMWCPYISANDETWQMYASVASSWLDFADLGLYSSQQKSISYLRPGTEIRKRGVLIPPIRKPHVAVPIIQYSPVEKAALTILGMSRGERKGWGDWKRSTLTKALDMLEDLNLIRQEPGKILLEPILKTVTRGTASQVFGRAILEFPTFAAFIELLESNRNQHLSQLELGRLLRDRVDSDWKDETAKVYIKIMLDWARHTGLAPGVFKEHPRKKKILTIKMVD
jgi:Restriction endonuclease